MLGRDRIRHHRFQPRQAEVDLRALKATEYEMVLRSLGEPFPGAVLHKVRDRFHAAIARTMSPRVMIPTN